MTRRKILLSLLMVAMVCFMAIFITACEEPSINPDNGGGGGGTEQGGGSTDNPTVDTCQHLWTSWEVITTPDCTTAGENRRSCAVCFEVQSEVLDALGHSYSTNWQTDSDSHWHICTRCNDDKIDEGYHTFNADNECTTCGFVKVSPTSTLTFNPIIELSETIGYEVSGANMPSSQTVVSIPATYSDLPVLKIAAGAFENNTKITRVIIPESVVEIKGNAFAGCTSLTSIVIPSTVNFIAEDAFKNCYKLIEVYNCSNILETPIVAGGSNNGGVARYARNVYTPVSGESKLSKQDDYIFYSENSTTHYLMGYVGAQASLVLPQSFNGASYSIYRYAFYLSSTLTGVTIPETILSIGANAFEGCSGMTGTLTLPAGLKSIDNYAFKDCLGYTNIVIPDTVTAIGNNAFEGCNGLFNITIPNSVTTIGDYAFAGCRGLNNITLSNTLMTIGAYAFSNCSGLTSITIPASVQFINREAFSLCNGLAILNFGASAEETVNLREIGDGAFRGCNGLAKLTIPASVIKIGQEAFSDCSGLSTLEIMDSKASIGEKAFYNCSGLSTISFGNGVTSIGAGAFANCLSLTDLSIPDSATTIGNEAFSGCRELIKVTIGNGVTAIFSETFSGCTELVTLVIGSGVTTIYEDAFSAFGNLKNLTIGTGVKTIGERAFRGCVGLEELIIPDSVTNVANGAFDGCTNISNLQLGSGLTIIGERAFAALQSLEELIIPENVTNIGVEAFDDCTALESLTLGRSVTVIQTRAFRNCTSLTSLEIPDSVTTINGFSYSDNAFYGCSSIESLVMGNGITTITQFMFAGLRSSLKSVVIGEGVTTIGSGAFSNFYLLTDVNIGTGVTTIGQSAFYGCSSLREIVIPDNVITLSSAAFRACNALKKVTVGSGVKTVGAEAFTSTALESITFAGTQDMWGEITIGRDNAGIDGAVVYFVTLNEDGESYTINNILAGDNQANIKIPYTYFGKKVTAIADFAFDNNKDLESVEIPASVTSIGASAFNECINLAQVYYQGKLTDWNAIQIGSGNTSLTNASIGYANYMTYELATGYYMVTGLNTDAEEIELEIPAEYFGKPVMVIGRAAFKDCTQVTGVSIGANVDCIHVEAFAGSGITSIDIPSNVEELVNSAFENCISLTNVRLSYGLEYIGDNAFAGTAITSITIPNDVNIREGAFKNCVALTEVVFGTGTRNIAKNAFDGCGLTSVAIPDSVTTLGEEAFANCLSLTTATIGSGVTELPDRLFYNSGLTSIVVPNNIETLGDGVFQSCLNLETVRLGANVTEIGVSAFNLCRRLNTVYFDGMLTDWQTINRGADNSLLEVLDSQNKIGYANYLTYELNAAGDAYTVTGEVAGLAKISIVVPDRYFDIPVTTIAFAPEARWTGLNYITIGYNITTISANSFNTCSGLSRVYYAGSEQDWLNVDKSTVGNDYILGDVAIGYANYLTYEADGNGGYRVTGIIAGSTETGVVVPNTYFNQPVSAIVANAFHDNTVMTSIVIPVNVTVIGAGAFNEALVTIYYEGDATAWASVAKEALTATVYIYSESEPTETGNFWHYVEGVPTAYAPYVAPTEPTE